MLARSSSPDAEEWAIHDYEGFGPIRLSEWADLDKVAEIGALIEQHGAAFAAYAENLFDELYAHEVPEHIAPHIDYEAFARYLFMGEHYSIESESGVCVFRNCDPSILRYGLALSPASAPNGWWPGRRSHGTPVEPGQGQAW